MERRKPLLTPEEYARAVISLSKRHSSTSVFPGNNYVDLGEWIRQERALLGPPRSDVDATVADPFASKSKHTHDLAVVYSSGEKKWGVESFTQGQHEAFLDAVSVPEEGSGQIVFIRGFISPSWVSAIGSRYRIEPEFFRRHMDFLSMSVDRHAFGFPSLASSSTNIFRLCVSTLLHRDNFGAEELDFQRKEQARQLATYKTQQLGSAKVSCGDSIVREYSTLCASFSVIEQWISIYVAKQDNGWTVVAWMDQGRSLDESPPGPWTSHLKSKATALPILQNHHKMAFRTTNSRLDTDSNASAQIQQSAAILPSQYDSLISLVDLARRASSDPLSMCIPLFAHAAFSEVQFLNLMETKIQVQINALAEGVPDDAVGTFQYFSSILGRHTAQLKDSLRGLEKLAERSTKGIKNVRFESSLRSEKVSGLDGTFTLPGLTYDHEQLIDRCADLSAMCMRGITLAMNRAAVEESSKAIEQSQRLKKLTVLATFFIPLNFSSSLFGMNFDVLGQGTVSLWWFFVLCIPITLVAYLVYLWDVDWLQRQWTKLRQGVRSLINAKTKIRAEKDPGHLV